MAVLVDIGYCRCRALPPLKSNVHTQFNQMMMDVALLHIGLVGASAPLYAHFLRFLHCFCRPREPSLPAATPIVGFCRIFYSPLFTSSFLNRRPSLSRFGSGSHGSCSIPSSSEISCTHTTPRFQFCTEKSPTISILIGSFIQTAS